jgi:hypothetical protein
MKEAAGTAADTYRSQLVVPLGRPGFPVLGYARREAAHSRGHRCQFWKPAELCLPVGHARFDGDDYPCQAPKS